MANIIFEKLVFDRTDSHIKIEVSQPEAEAADQGIVIRLCINTPCQALDIDMNTRTAAILRNCMTEALSAAMDAERARD